MNWLVKFFTSSIGKKIIMSLTGLFLCSFLLIHLIGNFQLLKNDGGLAFNEYAKFMTSNPLIKTVSYLLYGSILLHTIQGLILWRINKKAKGVTPGGVNKSSTFASRNMALLGTIVLVFILIHMRQFWFEYKFGEVGVDTNGFKNLYAIVALAFSNIYYVVFYVIGMLAIGYHLSHGFQSGFQTLGLNHPKYTPAIKALGLGFSILVAFGFSAIPIYMFLNA